MRKNNMKQEKENDVTLLYVCILYTRSTRSKKKRKEETPLFAFSMTSANRPNNFPTGPSFPSLREDLLRHGDAYQRNGQPLSIVDYLDFSM